MMAVTLGLGRSASTIAKRESDRFGLTVEQYCSGLLNDALLGIESGSAQTSTSLVPVIGRLNSMTKTDSDLRSSPKNNQHVKYQFVPLADFKITGEFQGFPTRSIEFANRVLDELKQYDGIEVARVRTGIGVNPNFVFIEALLKQAGRSGIRVSFYNRKGIIMKEAKGLMNYGQGNYCRCLVETNEVLEKIIPLVHRAHQLKLGSS